MKADTLFYRLFQRWPKLALELLGLEYRSESYRFGSEEIKQTAFRLDGLFTPTEGNAEQPLIFVEVQYQPDGDFYDRFFSEITLYLRLHKPAHPWLALVIYPARSTEKAASIAFSPFMDFIETILVYKLPRLSREEIKTMLALNEIELKQTRFYQEVVEEGRQEGMQKGRQEGEQILLQRMLTRRFGEIPDWAQKRLLQASPEQLEQWADRLLDVPTLDAVFND